MAKKNTPKQETIRFTRGQNCLLSARNFSEMKTRVVAINHGVNIIADQADSRNYRVFYPKFTTSSSFEATFSFSTYEAANSFAEWLEAWGRRISMPGSRVGPVRMVVPARNFDRTAIPTRGIEYGDEVGRLSTNMIIEFMGARNPLGFDSPLISKFRLPSRKIRKDHPEIPYFYPAGVQLKGELAGNDYLYDHGSGGVVYAEDIEEILNPSPLTKPPA